MGKKKGGGKQAKASGGGKKKRGGGKYAAMEDGDSGGEDANNASASRQGRRGGKKKTRGGRHKARNQEMLHDDDVFRKTLLAQGSGSFSINEMAADGNCLFRSLSDQLFGDYGNGHDIIRQNVCSFLEDNEEEFAVFLLLDEHDEDVADFDTYVGRMKEDGEWGGNVELVAAARYYGRTITVYSPTGAFSIESGHDEETGDKLLLSYHGQDHYNSVRDENTKIKPTTIPPPDKNYKPKKKKCSGDGGDEKKDDVGDAVDLPVAEEGGREDQKNCANLARESTEDNSNQHGRRPERILRKNDPCHCGSGLRYKKCCLVTEKSRARAAKWKENNRISGDGGDGESDGGEEEVEEVGGTFRFLKI